MTFDGDRLLTYEKELCYINGDITEVFHNPTRGTFKFTKNGKEIAFVQNPEFKNKLQEITIRMKTKGTSVSIL